jgi:hypothetical protein
MWQGGLWALLSPRAATMSTRWRVLRREDWDLAEGLQVFSKRYALAVVQP